MEGAVVLAEASRHCPNGRCVSSVSLRLLTVSDRLLLLCLLQPRQEHFQRQGHSAQEETWEHVTEVTSTFLTTCNKSSVVDLDLGMATKGSPHQVQMAAMMSFGDITPPESRPKEKEKS
ncbi:hypothetical protein EYF80_022988 [Liparis tanakae]|uniref:Uncharacterized protein n=1 Tax=Liparis tanakae TaxID=230148 RepID=A0A4Z2HLN9_9TELE|nr:hypothetical protein EYF80_022988 [Liparis tanakae]